MALEFQHNIYELMTKMFEISAKGAPETAPAMDVAEFEILNSRLIDAAKEILRPLLAAHSRFPKRWAGRRG